MAKDPAFLFYPQDFLIGCADLTMEERGQYITLLSLQHQKGTISEKTIRLTVGSASVYVLSKFKKDENGEYYNERLRNEVEKRSKFVGSRRENGKLGGRPRKPTKKLTKTDRFSVGLATHNLREDVNENEDLSVREDSFKKEVLKKDYPKEMLKEFISYWTEHNPNGKKMRFEMEKVFDLNRRLSTWNRRSKKFPKKKEQFKKLPSGLYKAYCAKCGKSLLPNEKQLYQSTDCCGVEMLPEPPKKELK